MQKINLLILDDKKENIISLTALLQDLEYVNIISSTDPNEALKICWKDGISIALVDVQMPEINGFEFVSFLKSNPKTSHIIAIMVTAISKEDKYLLKGLESGAVDYLYKPLNPEITIAKVKSFVKQLYIQEELKHKNSALEESKKELIRLNQAAEEAKKSKEIFLANMSHEIRTPINGIVGIIHMLRGSQLTSEQRDWISRLDTASSSLILIINDILDISKIDSGMMKIEEESFSIRQKLEDISHIFKNRAEEKNLAFILEIDPKLPKFIKTDSLRVQQIINNFISNSIKFTESGKIILKAEVTDQVDKNITIKFSVADTGIGIQEDAIEKIFLAFEQGDDGITKKYGGTGLGLAIVKKLAELLKGEITAKSEYGKGSEFAFIATFQEVDDIGQHKKDQHDTIDNLESLGALKILVAEDNDLNSFMLAHILKSWGCQVDLVKNGRQAVDHVSQQNYDLILMDTHMPVLSGFEAIREIKKMDHTQKTYIPIITISASVLEHEQAAAYEAGADGVIGKPFDPSDLHKKIRAILGKGG